MIYIMVLNQQETPLKERKPPAIVSSNQIKMCFTYRDLIYL